MKKRSKKRARADEPGKTSAADADAEFFRREMADVIPLAPDLHGRVRVVPPLCAPRPKTSPPASSSVSQADDAGSEAAFVAPGVDRRELRKLKRGEHVPGRRLDLHGQTASEAVARVKAFIDSARHGHRAVCIVHGRGLHSEGNVSVLKTRVRTCLRQHPAVLAYSDAPQADGGPGAVYVLLRK